MEDCLPTLYTIPTLPARIPGNGKMDKIFFLHVTGRYKIITLDTYRLKVIGNVDNLLELTYDQIRCLPRVTADPLLVCPGLFNDTATWKGVKIKTILDLAGISTGRRIWYLSARRDTG